jgi:lipopolysaccharide export system permease protein
MIMDLEKGEIHQMDATDIKSYRRIQFTKHRIVMDSEQFEFQRSAENAFTRGDREMSAQAMLTIVDSLKKINEDAERSLVVMLNKHFGEYLSGNFRGFRPQEIAADTNRISVVDRSVMRARVLANSVENELARLEYNDRTIDRYMVEIYKKYAIPVACIVFVLVGAPLGVMARRGGFGVAAGLSLGFFLLYWACLIGGEKLADRDIISPFLGMWLGNILIGLLGIYLTIRTLKETVVIDWTRLSRFVPKRFRGGEITVEEGKPRLG